MPQFSSSADIFDRNHTWQWRALRASHSSTIGAVVMAMLAREPKFGPALGPTCDIWPDGRIATRIRRNGVWSPHPEPIGSSISVRDEMRRLADHCKFSDAEREALFTELGKWVRKDFRVRSDVKAGM